MSGLAAKICDLALRLMPDYRRQWGEAMRIEITSASNAEALSWACGCFWTAFSERMQNMTGNIWRTVQSPARLVLAAITLLYGSYRAIGFTIFISTHHRRSIAQDMFGPSPLQAAAPILMEAVAFMVFAYALAFRRTRLLFASALILTPLCLLNTLEALDMLSRLTGSAQAGFAAVIALLNLPPLVIAASTSALLWRSPEHRPVA